MKIVFNRTTQMSIPIIDVVTARECFKNLFPPDIYFCSSVGLSVDVLRQRVSFQPECFTFRLNRKHERLLGCGTVSLMHCVLSLKGTKGIVYS